MNIAHAQVQGINGVMQLVAALPAGYLTDRVRRDTMLKAAAVVGALAGRRPFVRLLAHACMASSQPHAAMTGKTRCTRGTAPVREGRD